MEDDEETQSPDGRISVTLAAATPPLAIALPAQLPRSNGHGFGAVGSREDCWSEGATSVLIDAWGERYLQLSRGNLKQQHWKEVADVVHSKAEDHSKIPKTDVQCKNRIDTVKKKYKAEKAKLSAGGPPSSWPFYSRLDHLIGPTTGTTIGSGSIRSGSTRIQNQKLKKKKMDFDSDSEPEPPSPDSTDSLPPETKYPYKRARTQRECDAGVRGGERKGRGGWGESVRELTRAILKFGEAYEMAERSKVEQMVEMEKQRMKFAKELEIQRMQFFMKTQLEISQLKQRRRRENRSNASNNNDNSRARDRAENNHENDADNDRRSDSSS